MVALPLALAFGISSGVGAAAGLITAVVAGLVAAVFGGSHVQVPGPTGAMAVVLAPIVAHYGFGSIALVTRVGRTDRVARRGAPDSGRAVTFIPWPVIEGFTLGIAMIIFLQQVPAAFGSDRRRRGEPVARGVERPGARRLDHRRQHAAAWWRSSPPSWSGLPRLHRAIPESLAAVVAATVLVGGCASARRTHRRTAVAPADSGPAACRPRRAAGRCVGAALAIAALAAIESLLSARVAATMSPTGPYDPDRELVGQGLASVASGLFGGMPATGAIARTAVNVRSGARTRCPRSCTRWC